MIEISIGIRIAESNNVVKDCKASQALEKDTVYLYWYGIWDLGGIYISFRRKPFSYNFCGINNIISLHQGLVEIFFDMVGLCDLQWLLTLHLKYWEHFTLGFFLRCRPPLYSSNLTLLFCLYSLYEEVLRLLFGWKAFKKEEKFSIYIFAR